MATRVSAWALAVAAPVLCAAAVLAQVVDYAFMPPGGRTLFMQIVGEAPGEDLAGFAGQQMGRADWQAWAAARAADLDDKALATFAGYAELNFPLEGEALAKLAGSGDAALLPPDGKDLSIAQCQFCHSLFSGYLMHRRDEVGWKGTFKAPFHSEIPMSEVERDTFARYSALNMPLRFEDVPPELRF